jgi:hypothetical protein
MKRKAAKGCNLVAAMSNQLIQLGRLLLDPTTVCAIMPMPVDSYHSAEYVNVITTGGSLELTDPETCESVVRHFSPDYKLALNPEYGPQPEFEVLRSPV